MSGFKRIYLLYVFGFLINLRPVDPFLYEFFVTHKNLTEKEVRRDILPVLSYSSAIHSLFVFLLADLIGYKTLIIISALFELVSISVKKWGTTVIAMEFSEVFRGGSVATEVAYFIFIYGHYDGTTYQRATAYARIAALMGKTLSAILGQLFHNSDGMSCDELYVLNLAVSALATITTFFLPTDGENVYHFSTTSTTVQKAPPNRIGDKLFLFQSNFVENFKQNHIQRWSFWCAFSLWTYTQISTFIQPLWANVHKSKYNGTIEATLGFLAFLGVVVAGFKSIDWKSRTVVTMHVLSGFQYILLLCGIAFSNGYILFNYVCYVLFGMIHYFIITAISAEIAKIQHNNCFGMVFGLIYFAAYLMNAILVCAVNDDVGIYMFTPQREFLVYFIVFLIAYVVFFVASIIKQRVNKVITRH
ncbi:thiamine transporter 1 [Tribolium castaneum]|uniref:thiamine transporter 1 n=1 Tax=Tribolium castaneum TaxID=7070 RepID=UPI00046C0B6E|nr:PREDICTED: thiamine transporter 1-like [Tribolium castaneum]|eukprot:XP_008193586.1 PREDICTED: thiamine transporter 1-like [Tribolium castaneum]